MSTTTPFPGKPNNPIAIAHHAMIAGLAALKVPGALNAYPMPREFLAVRDYLADVAKLVDAMVAECGHQVKHAASHSVDMKVFEQPMFGALDGMATFEIESAAEAAAADFTNEELG